MPIHHVVFRIRQPYFDEIVAGTKKVEVRRLSPHWSAVLARITETFKEASNVLGVVEGIRIKPGLVAVFVCGRQVHRRKVRGVKIADNAELVLGRPLSAQGREDVGRGHVLAFDLGEEVSH